MEMQNGHSDDKELEAPPRLVAAFKQLPKTPIFIPPTLDEALIKAARQHLAAPEKKRTLWSRLRPWTAAAAGFAAVILVAYPHAKELLGFGQSRKAVRRGWENVHTGIQIQSHGLAYAREDLNRDGKVDILDAFMLAKKLQALHVSDPNLDINRDGIVDRRDAEAIAAHAVSLEKRGHS